MTFGGCLASATRAHLVAQGAAFASRAEQTTPCLPLAPVLDALVQITAAWPHEDSGQRQQVYTHSASKKCVEKRLLRPLLAVILLFSRCKCCGRGGGGNLSYILLREHGVLRGLTPHDRAETFSHALLCVCRVHTRCSAVASVLVASVLAAPVVRVPGPTNKNLALEHALLVTTQSIGFQRKTDSSGGGTIHRHHPGCPTSSRSHPHAPPPRRAQPHGPSVPNHLPRQRRLLPLVDRRPPGDPPVNDRLTRVAFAAPAAAFGGAAAHMPASAPSSPLPGTQCRLFPSESAYARTDIAYTLQ